MQISKPIYLDNPNEFFSSWYQRRCSSSSLSCWRCPLLYLLFFHLVEPGSTITSSVASFPIVPARRSVKNIALTVLSEEWSRSKMMLIFNDDRFGWKRGEERGRKKERSKWKRDERGKGERWAEKKRDSEYARYSARLGATLANFPVVDDCSDAKSLQLPRRLSLSRWCFHSSSISLLIYFFSN